MKKLIVPLCILLNLLLVLGASWPADSGVSIHQNLPSSGYEPSGIVWHPYYNALFVVNDKGTLSKMNPDGTGVTSWTVAGDLEGLAVADPTSKYIYIVVEYPYKIIQFNPESGSISKSIDLTEVISATVTTNLGIEGMTYVPKGDHPYSINNGLFYFGVQENGKIYVLNVNFTAGTAALVDSFTPVSGRGDISDLYFSPETKTLYILYDGANLLREIKTDKTYLVEYTVPGTEQEGVYVSSGCPNTKTTIFIAEDKPIKLMKYKNYPIVCPVMPPGDSDGDGVPDANDKCPGFDDKLDLDADGIPNGCDTIDNRDSDGDGVINSNDKCPGFDDKLDLDTDGIPNGCDTIDNRDSDGDGIINQYDTWPLGFEIPIQQNLPAGFESSGIVWHPFYGASFLVSDKGTVSKVNLDGLGVTSWSMSGDLEGITIADPASKYVYIVVEFPSQLIQFDPSTGTKVKTISLAGVVPATIDPNLGIQGVAYVPFGYHPYTNIKNGLFYFGVQEDGKIHVVNVDFTSGIVALIDSFTPVSGRVDISDLYFSTETKILYILYDSTNLLREITVNNTYLKESFLPGAQFAL